MKVFLRYRPCIERKWPARACSNVLYSFSTVDAQMIRDLLIAGRTTGLLDHITAKLVDRIHLFAEYGRSETTNCAAHQ